MHSAAVWTEAASRDDGDVGIVMAPWMTARIVVMAVVLVMMIRMLSMASQMVIMKMIMTCTARC